MSIQSLKDFKFVESFKNQSKISPISNFYLCERWFLCIICKRHVACENQGKPDVERHITSTMHQANAVSSPNLP